MKVFLFFSLLWKVPDKDELPVVDCEPDMLLFTLDGDFHVLPRKR
jgi:hypothetical protein